MSDANKVQPGGLTIDRKHSPQKCNLCFTCFEAITVGKQRHWYQLLVLVIFLAQMWMLSSVQFSSVMQRITYSTLEPREFPPHFVGLESRLKQFMP